VSHNSARIIVESRDGVGWILLDHPPLNGITTVWRHR